MTQLDLGHLPHRNYSNIRLSENAERLFEKRRDFSDHQTTTLARALKKDESISGVQGLTIFCAGSYGRLEASKFSDIDLFFILDRKDRITNGFNIPQLKLMSSVLRIGSEMEFPTFSNDGQFLRVLFFEDIMAALGSASDDYQNFFTARLLMILESRCLTNKETYDTILQGTIESYFRDYDHHPDNFRPVFLVNDIIRFWKTLCLNYEHRRNQENDRTKIKQKIKNLNYNTADY